MKTLLESIREAEAGNIAIGHFNFSNIEMFWAIIHAARRMELPVILGTSEEERGFIGIREAVALVRTAREELGHPIFLNADHTYTFQGVKDAIAAGYDSVTYDASKKPTKDNLKETKMVVEYVKSKNPDILVEGNLGYTGSSARLHDFLPQDVSISPEHLTSPEDAANFVKETGVDLLAPAVGGVHGKLKHDVERLDIDRIKLIKNATGIPLVLHGGSGIKDQDFHRAIPAGISVVHVGTELRLAYRMGIKNSLIKFPDEIAPYKLMENVMFEIEKVVEIKLKTFMKVA